MEKNHVSFLKELFGENEEPRKRIFCSMKVKTNAKRTIDLKLYKMIHPVSEEEIEKRLEKEIL